MKLAVSDPNVSIIVPGGCNANCSFCFWKHEASRKDYIEWLKETLDNIPDEFRSLSLTGGEPTLGLLNEVLSVIDSKYCMAK